MREKIKAKGNRDSILTVRVNKELAEKVKQYCEDNNMAISYFLSQLIEMEFNN